MNKPEKPIASIIDEFQQLVDLRRQLRLVLADWLEQTPFTVRNLAILSYLDQHVLTSSSELAVALGVTKSLISRETIALFRRDLITIQTNAIDRRVVDLSLTTLGEIELIKAYGQIRTNLTNFEKITNLTELADQVAKLKQILAIKQA